MGIVILRAFSKHVRDKLTYTLYNWIDNSANILLSAGLSINTWRQ